MLRVHCWIQWKIAPNHSMIRNIVSVFEKTGSVSPTPPKRKSPSKKRGRQKWVENHGNGVTQYISLRKEASALGVYHRLSTMFCMTICIGNFTIGISWSRMTTNKGWILLSGFFLSPRRPKSFSSAVMKRISHLHCQLISKNTECGDLRVRMTGLKCL